MFDDNFAKFTLSSPAEVCGLGDIDSIQIQIDASRSVAGRPGRARTHIRGRFRKHKHTPLCRNALVAHKLECSIRSKQTSALFYASIRSVQERSVVSLQESARTVVMQTIGQLIRSYRAHRGLTLRELAARTLCTPGYLSQIETGRARRPPSARILQALEVALHTPPGKLIEHSAIEQLPQHVRTELVSLKQTRAQVLQLASLVARIQSDALRADDDWAEVRTLAAALRDVDSHSARMIPVLNRPGHAILPGALPGEAGRCRAEHWIALTGTTREAFALYPPDDAMVPLASSDDLVVYDGMMPPTLHGLGLARLKGDEPVTLALFYSGSGPERWRLQPANPAYRSREVGSGEIHAVYRPVSLIRPVDASHPLKPAQMPGIRGGPGRVE